MKRIYFLGFALFLFLTPVFSQKFYEISRDKNGSKVLKGIITRDDISNDTAFQWFLENQKGYKPNADAVSVVRKNADSIEFVAFAGTWCSDSRFVIPKFFTLLDSAAFPQNQVTLIGVDRSKKTISHLAEAFHVENIPTIIVMKNGKELGRVVEYGTYGMFDKELGEIIKNDITSAQ